MSVAANAANDEARAIVRVDSDTKQRMPRVDEVPGRWFSEVNETPALLVRRVSLDRNEFRSLSSQSYHVAVVAALVALLR